ncbi:DUF4440 domain-containing protein [Halobacillus sp. Marseille-Q1614]|uniref:nuclear transport factor 2 family protein n=1 Tax=Halobacillus sp. Marseille-Q1614 TaxID=2709134 RepID=UPI00157110FE|nr:DUF4440 domain-containing protein [Halobacillus sp. Marseille-Q1614]
MDNNFKEQLKKLEESHLNLEVRRSSEELDKILADEFFEFGSSGKIINKNDCINAGVTLDELKLYDFEIHPLARDVVLTTYYIHNKTKKRNSLRSSIWKFQKGRWKLFFHQGTVTNRQVSETEEFN